MTMAEDATGGAPQQTVPKDACTMAMLCHLLGVLVGFLGPLIVWLIKKNEHPFIDDQGKEALNFQLTVLIGYVISAVLAFFCVGVFLAAILWVVNIIFCIMGAVKANGGEKYRYPFAIRFVK